MSVYLAGHFSIETGGICICKGPSLCICGHTWRQHYYAEDDVYAPCLQCACHRFIRANGDPTLAREQRLQEEQR